MSVFFTSSTDGRLFLNFIHHHFQFHNQVYRNEFETTSTFYISPSNSEGDKTGIETDLHGGVNKNIHAENIKNQVIAIPPLEEQTTIANFLDEKTTQIDKLIASKQIKFRSYSLAIISFPTVGARCVKK